MGLESRPTNELQFVKAFLGNTRGIIPSPVNAQRVNDFDSVSGVASNDIYTVAVGKRLFISSALLSSRESADASSVCHIAVKDASNNWRYTVLRHTYDKAGQQTTFGHFSPALEVEQNEDVYVQSLHANIDADAYIFCWLENA